MAAPKFAPCACHAMNVAGAAQGPCSRMPPATGGRHRILPELSSDVASIQPTRAPLESLLSGHNSGAQLVP